MKEKITSVFVGVVMSFAGLQAQNLYVKETNGVQNTFALTNVRKLTFPSEDSMYVYKYDESITKYLFISVSYFDFVNNPTEITQSAIQSNGLQLFPNPVNDEFQISYQPDQTGILSVQIINEQGKVVMQQRLCGRDLITINASQLLKGIYVCIVQSDDRIEKAKCIKN